MAKQDGWRPHPGPQKEFCSRGEFEVLFGGAAGPGKTDCLIMEATRDIWHPRYRAIILRRTFPQLQEIIDRCHRWYREMWPDAFYKATEHRWYFSSGATIQLGHMQHEDDKYNYQGKEFHYIGFDELSQFTETQYLYLFSRARSTIPELSPVIRGASNPGNIGHRWVKERFVDVTEWGKTYIDQKTGLSRAFIPGRWVDNPSLVENDPDYVQRLRMLPEIERLRLEEGIWDIFEGQAFPELSQRVHGCDPFDIPPEWERFMAFDWGYSKPFSVGWYAIDLDGIIYRYREWYGTKENTIDDGLKMTSTDIARGIIQREKERIKYRVADPACWSKNPTKDKRFGPSIIEDMQKEGLFFIKADNNRILGKQQVHQRFKLEEDKNAEGEVIKEYPRFMAFNNQKYFWRTMMELRLNPNNDEDVDEKQPDHIYDEFRYACMSRPIVPKLMPKGPPPGSFMAERNKMIRAKQYARRYGISLADAYRKIR